MKWAEQEAEERVSLFAAARRASVSGGSGGGMLLCRLAEQEEKQLPARFRWRKSSSCV